MAIREWVGLHFNVTRQREDEQALQLRDFAVRSISQGIIINDPRLHDNPIIFANPGFEAITGYQSEEVLGRNCRFLQGPETDPSATAELRHAVAAEIPCTVELLNYRKDGAMFWNAVTLLPVYDGAEQLTHIVGVQIDVTERKRLEARLRQYEKLEAIIQLAGGVAHDFNNMLAVINSYSASLSQSDRLNKSELEAVADLRAAGERAARRTRQLLAFSRQQVLKPTIVNLNEVVVETERMLSRVIGEDIRILSTLEPTLWPIRIDPGQFERILFEFGDQRSRRHAAGWRVDDRNSALWSKATESASRSAFAPVSGRYSRNLGILWRIPRRVSTSSYGASSGTRILTCHQRLVG